MPSGWYRRTITDGAKLTKPARIVPCGFARASSPRYEFQNKWRIAKADAIAFVERARFSSPQ